ncbi:MAG: aldehyde dehydrogenase family protein [Halieaceae bacterium]|nr:aldehyde dehydrogenase family protein [Halieaceae bacterium]
MQNFQLLINGQSTPGASTMPVINPANEEIIAQCPRADEAQLNEAVLAAKTAFPAWASLDISDRRAKLLAIADDLEPRTEEFASLLTAEQGKPVKDATEEIFGTAVMIRMLAANELPEKVLMDNELGRYIEHRSPLGVVAAITPWNMPVTLMAIKVVSALLTGNTVVAKPAPTTPLTTLLFAELANRYLPPGVFNVITDLNDLGSALTTHPDIAKISFTGSTATGKKVMQSASSSVKRVTLELGGNDAAIVLDDVDPKEVAASLFAGAMVNCGQICLAIKRAYVPSAIYDEVCDELVNLADNMKVGDGSDPATELGPIQNKMQFERVKELLESARTEGNIVAGGDVSDTGFFVRPTIVRDVDDSARIVREEQFGPILPVLSYDDLDDAIARANDSSFGLGGTVWTANAERGAEVARRIHTGICWVNSHMAFHPDVATGGAKQSGLGQEMGVEGIEEFTQRHVVFTPNA